MIQDKNIRDNQVSQSVSLECVDGSGQAMVLDGVLGYVVADPYAVSMTFRTSSGDVIWTFARDLMVRGLTTAAGDGDVHVWPCLDNSGDAIVIVELSSPDGELLVQVPTRELYRFVNRTLALVPVGNESEYVNIDRLIEQLMAA